MEPVSIEGGCSFVAEDEGVDIWAYEYGTVDGVRIVLFTTYPGIKPHIGDMIVDGKLVKRTEPKINGDTSRWETRPDETWPSRHN